MNTESKKFYKSLFTIVGPIAIQNLISAAVSSADVIMLGKVSQTAIAASSLAGQVQFILFLLFTGVSSGSIMLSSQYWGKKDTESIKCIMGTALRISCIGGLIFAIACFFFPRAVMYVFTKDTNLIEAGSIYLKAVSLSYIFLAISQVYQAVLKSIEHVKIVTVTTTLALGLNILLNAIFIFGWFGLPKMGIFGAALGTTISRFIEMSICICVPLKMKDININPCVLFKNNKLLTRDFFHFSLPAIGNEFVWGAAFAMYSVILGHLGEDIVAANSVISVVRNLCSVLCFGMAYGGAIVLGNQMGHGDLDLAKRNASRLVKSTILAGLAGSVLIICLKPILPFIAQLNDSASSYRNILLYINALSIFGAATNTVMICGVFRSGGDSKFGFVMDTFMMWCVSVPLGLLAAFVFKLPPVWVYFILYLDEFEKMPLIVIHYFKGKWLQNITRDINQAE